MLVTVDIPSDTESQIQTRVEREGLDSRAAWLRRAINNQLQRERQRQFDAPEASVPVVIGGAQ
jgi:Arc/MetJ-type ribon-helix-helix transcriptional regulator